MYFCALDLCSGLWKQNNALLFKGKAVAKLLLICMFMCATSGQGTPQSTARQRRLLLTKAVVQVVEIDGLSSIRLVGPPRVLLDPILRPLDMMTRSNGRWLSLLG
jgi:hypothetical protein